MHTQCVHKNNYISQTIENQKTNQIFKVYDKSVILGVCLADFFLSQIGISAKSMHITGSMKHKF
jgi:hypothetical protein